MANATAAYANPGSRVIALRASRRAPGIIYSGLPLNEPGVNIDATVLEITGLVGKRGQLHQSRRGKILASTDEHTRVGSEIIIDGQFRNYVGNGSDRVIQELEASGHQVVVSLSDRGDVTGVSVRRRRKQGEPLVTATDGSEIGPVYTWRGERGV